MRYYGIMTIIITIIITIKTTNESFEMLDTYGESPVILSRISPFQYSHRNTPSCGKNSESKLDKP